jgi:hypothetical protein
MMGLEAGAEGPISKKSGASYVINGRYSVLDVLAAIGVFNETDGTPEYKDICAKFNFPLKSGNLSLVTLLGNSHVRGYPPFKFDPPELEDGILLESDQNLQKYGQIFTGLNYTHRFNASTRLENRLSYQWMRDALYLDLVEFPSFEVVSKNHEAFNNREARIAYSSTLNHRFSAKSSIKSGIGADFYYLNFLDINEGEITNNYNGNSTLLKGFTEWQYRLGTSFSVIPGVYGHYYTFSKDYSIEPRLGFKWEASPMTSFSLGGGLHSQLLHRKLQMFEDETHKLVNRNVKMMKSWQAVAGYDQKLGTGMRLKTEVYYQWLFDVPVLPSVPQESFLNYAQEDEFDTGDMIFVNEGTGRNYGLEITLEKFFDKHYYFLLTASLYDSKYTAYDKIERHTRFAGNYAFNALFGYEWKTGKRSLLSANTKIAYLGGKREVPLNNVLVEGESDVYEWEFDYTQAYKKRLPAYFRLDLKVNMKTNYKRYSLEWFVEIVNLTNHKNIRAKYYDARSNEFYYSYHYSLLPIFGCKVYF